MAVKHPKTRATVTRQLRPASQVATLELGASSPPHCSQVIHAESLRWELLSLLKQDSDEIFKTKLTEWWFIHNYSYPTINENMTGNDKAALDAELAALRGTAEEMSNYGSQSVLTP